MFSENTQVELTVILPLHIVQYSSVAQPRFKGLFTDTARLIVTIAQPAFDDFIDTGHLVCI